MEHVWMAEVGCNGWSQLCESLAEARQVLAKRLEFLRKCGYVRLSEYQLACSMFAIWKDGVYFEGVWPLKRK